MLVRWRALASARALAHDLHSTLQGRLTLLLLVVASPGLFQLLREGGSLAGLPLDAGSRSGALLIAQVALTACFAIMVPVVLGRNLLIRREREPVLAHPSALPDVAMIEVAGALFGTSGFLWAFFYLFYGPVLATNTGDNWALLGVHFGAAQLQFFALGILFACVTRYALTGGDGLEEARRLQRLSVFPFLVSLPVFALLPAALHRHDPSWLSTLDLVARRSLHFLQTPIAILDALQVGQGSVAAAGIAILVVTASTAAVALLRWRKRAPLELANLSSGVGSGPPRSLRFPRGGPTLWRQIRLFWIKTIVARDARRRRVSLGTHLPLIVAALVALLISTRLPELNAANQRALRFGTSELLILALAGLTLLRTLGTLGEEGQQLSLLRSTLSMRRLFVIKSAVNAAYVAGWAPIYAVAIGFGGRLVGSEPYSITGLMLIGIIMSIILAAAGSALGFLLPDYAQTSLLLPGASRAGELLFVACAALLVASHTAPSYLESAGVGTGAAWAVRLGVPAALLSVLSVASAWGIRRAQRSDV